MSDSKLVDIINISPNRTSPRKGKIDTLTIHCFVAQVTAVRGCEVFAAPAKQASANYVIGYDGSIGLCVPESDRSWCSSSRDNDNRAITIEVASENVPPYTVTDKAYSALIALLVDICERNTISKLIWSESKTARTQHLNGCNMTVHRDYANKSCPGEYLYSRMQKIADEVNSKLQPTIYRVQVGAFKRKENADSLCKELAEQGYSAYVVKNRDCS